MAQEVRRESAEAFSHSSGSETPASSAAEYRPRPRRDLQSVVAELRNAREVTHNIRHGGVARRLPSRTALAEIVNAIATALFPTHYGEPDLGADATDEFVGAKLRTALPRLEEQIRLSLPLSTSGDAPELAAAERIAQDVTQEFASQLPE